MRKGRNERGARREPRRVIVIVGPDGSGKSSLADALVDMIGKHAEVQRFHHRLRALPSTSVSRQLTTEPHASAPYPAWLSIVKVIYLFIDQLLGWFSKVAPVLRRGGWVVIERGWWDLVVDPRRYRIRRGSALTSLLGRMLPQAGTVIVLDVSPSVMLERKSELPATELERQVAEWRRLAWTLPAVVLDGSLPRERVAELAAEAAGVDRSVRRRAPGRWVAVPPGNRVRWLLPVDSPRHAAAGLLIYQPMTARGRLVWEGARRAAKMGLLGVGPAFGSASALVARLASYIPSGGTVSVAFVRANRAVVLIIDERGHATAIAKIAFDTPGTRRLSEEAAHLSRFGALLAPPLVAPRILAQEEGLLLLEPVDWRVRARPWYLPPALASAMGKYAARGDNQHGLAHGDFAPWNVMRTLEGWTLVDWEDATESASLFTDPFHYLVQAHAFLGRPGLHELVTGLDGTGWVGRSLRAYVAGADAPFENVHEQFVSYLDTTIDLYDSHDHESAVGLQARRQLLSAVAGSR